jgi:hypothetical protein
VKRKDCLSDYEETYNYFLFQWERAENAYSSTENKRPSSGPQYAVHLPFPSFFAVHLASYKSLICTASFPQPSDHSSAPVPSARPSCTSIMLVPPQQGAVNSPTDPLVLYSQSLRDYTLRLWMESRKQAEERVRARTHKKHHGATKALPTPSYKLPTGGENVITGMSDEGSMLSS